jgi:UDPglucose 6-dehydrogenase
MNAGIAKLSVNTYVTTKITFANMLARLCEKVSGAIVDAVCIDASVEGAAQ